MSNFDKILHGGVDLASRPWVDTRHVKDGEDGELK